MTKPESMPGQVGLARVRTLVAAVLSAALLVSGTSAADFDWVSSNHFRLSLKVDARGRARSQSPLSVEVDFQRILQANQSLGHFDRNTVEVFTLAPATRKLVHVPHRIDELFGASMA